MSDIFGNVTAPPGVSQYGNLIEGGPTYFITNILRFLIVIAGIYALFNMVFAGYAFMSAGDDPKKVAGAWSKIWQSILGLAISAGAFVLAALFGRLLFGDYSALLRLRVFGPN
ncbi:hypothetical protein A3E15_02590 [Candidatus Woesebacteria bacterium RIFCSPHIGHO2_12_FULL_42_9]|uniref:Uncharacterized protein n=2 Tax=Candidatus Woeseibacteriota TaxID=1752722 RepID=A0A1F8AX90_9BACT|nr:MAG: hypothetical protein A2129_01600 [Candidatus Woesebacteria bacterium GWC1_42_13]OGM55868.1 MAG: hypothetical protein A3E15_02590 [Candidatus Woesebacteria bacterium RIFCSPHIGHO2_12_FULL_42_9]